MTSSKGAALTLQEELERAAEGVLFISEHDAPLRFFTLPGDGEQDLTPEGFLTRLGLSVMLLDGLGLTADKFIEEHSFDDLFPTADDLADRSGVEVDDPEVVAESGGYRRVEEAIRKRLRDVKVFYVGQVDIRCYIAGLDERGNIAGLVATVIQT